MDNILIISIYDGWKISVLHDGIISQRVLDEIGDDPILERVFVLYSHWDVMAMPFSVYLLKKAKKLLKGYDQLIICVDGTIESLDLKNKTLLTL